MENDRTQPRDYEIDLEQVTGSPVIRVVGYIANEFGEPSFKITRVITADGKDYDAEGEHDFPYLVDLDQEKLNALYKR